MDENESLENERISRINVPHDKSNQLLEKGDCCSFGMTGCFANVQFDQYLNDLIELILCQYFLKLIVDV